MQIQTTRNFHKQFPQAISTVHRKATHTDKCLDFRSHHPLAHKIAVPRTLFSRARSLCTYVKDLDQEVSHVMKALKWNEYPKSAIKMSYSQSYSDMTYVGQTGHPPGPQEGTFKRLCITY